LRTQQPERAEAHGGEHDALEQRLPQRLHVEHEQQVADRAEHQRAEDRADRAARAAEQRDAAEDDAAIEYSVYVPFAADARPNR
jgi:hypothetical protein